MKLQTGIVGALRAGGLTRAALAATGVVAVAGLAALGALFASDQSARAQTPPSYYGTGYSTSGLPGFRLSIQTSTLAPDAAEVTTFYGSPTSPDAPARSERITALARSLENDPDRIYQFVRNTILFEPQFGLHKGADGVLLDGSGGSFDQSQLMVELLRASNYDARYVLGTVTLGAEAASILRVDTARQACLLLAVAGTPATVNGSTSCTTLSGAVSAVQMKHVWVEVLIGGSWYAFDPSLKTTTKITGVDLWDEAGATAASAWSNVSSGVAVSGGNLTGVNAANIQADMAGYATALQTSLIADHTDKSLKQLTGGWEIVRTETQLRNAALPGGSVSTRWAKDVPAPYRATLTLQTPGLDHTFDLAGIYGWRVQAQMQDAALKIAVRKREHLDARATAYFAFPRGGPQPCETEGVVCGGMGGAANRALAITINHPYAARRPGVDPNNVPWGLGTFADETVTKYLEKGKRADILVRTAGGNGGRRAAWASAHDPIQQHRIVPAGNDYNACYAMDGDEMVGAGQCDGQNTVDWTYGLQDSPKGNGPFAYGEVARAEMGTKKDSVLNAWTDLFDKTVGILEPLSGSRIFHQHSIGLSSTPSYIENVLDVETVVGIATTGTDQPHHILSALAALAVTDEALALGQSATDRPMFQGSPVQVTAPRRLGASVGLKVLTAAGSTTTLPADVTADTKAQIEAYLAKGFTVVSSTTANGNAFLARRNDGSEQAWILRSQAGGAAGDVDPRTYFLKGAASETPNPLDYLGKAESRRIAANVAGSLLGAVDLRTGALSFSEGTELSMGQGEFPYSLSFSRSYVSTGPVEGDGGLGMGWTHNWESSVSHATDTGAFFPEAETVTSAPMLIAALVALEAGRADTVQASVVSGIALDWLQAQADYNVTTVSGGGQTGRFVRLVDGTWRNPASPTESIAPVGEPFIGAYTRQINWTMADRSVMAFRDVVNPDPSPQAQDRQGVATSWTFPTGVVITLAYDGGTVTNRPTLSSVSNNLGALLTFTHTVTPTPQQTSVCQAAAGTFSDPGYRQAMQGCYEMSTSGGRLTKVQAGLDQITFTQEQTCPQFVNFCAFQLRTAARPGLRTRTYTYAAPTGAMGGTPSVMIYQHVLSQVSDQGVATPRARFDWRATGGQVAPYVAEAFDAQDRKTIYYPSTFTYSSARDAVNAVIRQTYDDDGRLLASADGLGRISRATYDGPGRTRTIRTPYGDLTAFTYDARGNLIQRTQTPIENCGAGFAAEQLAWWCQTVTIKAEYDAYWNKPNKIILPATAADPVEREWDLSYNAKGLLEWQKGPEVLDAVAGSNARPTWATTYDAFGRVLTATDPTGLVTTQVWSDPNDGMPEFCLRQTTAPAPTPITTTFACDAVGNVTSTTVGAATTTALYDNLRRKYRENGPAGTGIQTVWYYDENGDQTQVRNWDSAAAVDRLTTTVFSATHKPLTVTDPSGDVTRTCYDAVDRPTVVIDAERRATKTTYNLAGQPVVIDRWQRAAAGSCTLTPELPAGQTDSRWRRFLYNAGGLQVAEIDARGNATQQVYDGLGRLARTYYPDVDGTGPIVATQAWTVMDQRGQVVMTRQRSGAQASMFYDAMGRDFHVREYAFADRTYMWKGRNVRASYDKAGRPIWRDVSTQTTTGTTFDQAQRRDIRTYGYTAGYLTTDQWQPDGTGAGTPTLSFAYGYDARGNRSSITWPGSWTANYVYDGANRPQTVSFPGAGGATQTVTLTHDSLSRRTGINRPGAVADTTYTYEVDNDLASLNHAFVAGPVAGAVTFSYGHDAAGKTTSIGITQPAFEWMPTMAYARTYGVADPLNQIPSQTDSVTARGLTFDADGNLAQEIRTPVGGGTAVTWTYSWTYGNRLAGVSNNAPAAALTATYDYDSDDRRTKKTVNDVVTRMMWSGADEMAELDAAGNVLRRFVPDGSGAMDARLATVEANGTVYWHHTDHQGSVIATSNAVGQVVAAVSYSPHGEFGGSAATPPQGSPFGYTGRQYDVETGLYQYRARYYSPTLGQFLSTDPIGSKDDPNLYLYVANDPVNNTDPSGREAKVCGNRVCITPEDRTVPAVNIPNNVGARGFTPGTSNFHDYDVRHRTGMEGSAAAGAIGDAIANNPTPGDDQRASPTGTRNDVGALPTTDGTNIVRSFLIPSPDTSKFTDITVNYTVAGEHGMNEGFVYQFGAIGADGSITMRTYGEGHAWRQDPMLGFFWRPAVSDIWHTNQSQNIVAARRAMAR